MIGAAAKILGSTLTRYVGGVVLNAALSGSNQQNKKDTQGLGTSTPGTLSQSAVSTETGGAIFDKVLGKQTPKGKSPKLEVPEPAKVPEQKVDSNKELEKAAADLLNDPDSLSVSDKELKNHVVKIFGGGILPLLIKTEAKAVDAANNVRALNQNLLNTQSVFVDQNNILASKLDQILDIFGDQLEYQKQIKDKAQAQRRLDKLAQKQDESSVRAFLSTNDSKKKGKILSNMMEGLGAAKFIKKFEGLGKSTKDIISSIGGKGKAFTAAATSASSDFGNVGEFFAKQTAKSKKVKNAANKRLANAVKNADKTKRLRKLADTLGIEEISDLSTELKRGGIDALKDMYTSGFITPGEMSEFRDAAEKIGLDVRDLPDPVPNWEKAQTGKTKSAKPKTPTPKKNKVQKTPLGANPKKATAAVDKMLQTPKGAAKIMKPQGAAKGFGKLIPGIGAAISLGEAAYRFSQGDVAGGIMSIGSAIPILGWGFVAADIAREFGFDPLNTRPKDQYETGTGLTKPGTAILHGTEAVIGQNEQEDLLSSYRESIDFIGSNLVSVSVSLGDATGDSSAINSLIKKSGLTYDIVPMALNTDIGRHRPIGNVTKEISTNPMSALKDIFSGSGEPDIKENQNNMLEELVKKGKVNPLTSTPPIASSTPPGSTRNSSNPRNNAGTSNGVTIDESNEPGGDFTPDGDNNRVIFDGRVVEIGHQYNPNREGGDRRPGAGYGVYVVVRSNHPVYGEYDGLYAHFPGKNSVVVKYNQQVKRGDILGPMATKAQFESPTMRPIVGSGTGPHTSLDFLKVGSNQKHPNWRQLTDEIDYRNFGNKAEPKPANKGGDGGVRKKPPTRREEALLDTISFAEGTTDSYGTIFGGRVIPELSQGELTVKEVYDMMMTGSVRGRKAGYSKGSYATGRYQFMPDTILDIVNKYKTLEWTDKFTPEAQDRAILSRIANFRGVTDDMLKSEGLSNKVLDMLSGEFASFPQYDGSSMYNQPVKSQDKLRKIYQNNLESIPTSPKGIQKQIDRNQWLRDNDPANFFGSNTPQGKRADNLQLASSMTEESMDSPMVALQVVYVKSDNFVVNNNKPKSSRGSANFSEQYRMAVLGA